MKLKFDPSLAYQHDAVAAVADIFDGQPLGQTSFEISGTMPGGVTLTTYGVGNNLVLTEEQFAANIHRVQERNGIPKSDAEMARLREFSVEMETGTGKTYVYLRDRKSVV